LTHTVEILKMCLYTKNELSKSRLTKVIELQTDIQIRDRCHQNIRLPRRFAGGKPVKMKKYLLNHSANVFSHVCELNLHRKYYL